MTTDVQIEEKVKIAIQPPKLWKVVFFNDDSTPMDFVVELLTSIFKHSVERAKDLTLEIHNTGSAVAGIYSFEIAEHKAVESTHLSRANGFPLRITAEEE
jgi:ATP-dependent Clp protease adaptor protein ClpS